MDRLFLRANPHFPTIKYGLLYNWYAVNDARNIAPVGFHVPTSDERYTLRDAIGGWSVAGGHMKETGTTYWVSTQAGTDNSSGFNARGSGFRLETDGSFFAIRNNAEYWCSDLYDVDNPYSFAVIASSLVFSGQYRGKSRGNSLRFVADSGTPTTATGNDGRIYPCVTIGTQTWTAVDSVETKYRNGEFIPVVTDTTTWLGLTTGAFCVYDNDWTNAYNETYNTSNTGLFLRGRVQKTLLWGLDYNWYVVNDSRGIAPTGWHVPSMTEFNTLRSYLDSVGDDTTNVAGTYLKESGTTWWSSGNTGTNSSGFSARATGVAGANGSGASGTGGSCAYWTSTENAPGAAAATLSYNTTNFRTWLLGQADKHTGYQIRLIKNNSVNTGSMVDYDGVIYPTVTIGTQVWMARDLVVQHYNNGDAIPNVTDGTTWANTTSGAFSAPNMNDFSLVFGTDQKLFLRGRPLTRSYGLLYNRYAVISSKNLANTGWHCPTINEWWGLMTYIDPDCTYGNNTIALSLREIGSTYWGCNQGTNLYGFNLRGAGVRRTNSPINFVSLNDATYFRSSDSVSGYYGGYGISSCTTDVFYGFDPVNWGHSDIATEGWSVRLMKDSTSLSNGQTGKYYGNDGKVYNTICINGKEWLSENLAETKYRDGSIIPYYGVNNKNYTYDEWVALTTGALCAYNNDWNNV